MSSPLSRRAFFRWAGSALGVAVAARLAGRGRLLAAAGPGATSSAVAAARDDDVSEAVKAVLKQRFGNRPIREGHVDLTLPEAPPDGRVVPVFIESDLPMDPGNYVKALHLLVDKNPDIYLAGWQFSPAIGRASIDTRIKMRATSDVRAVAETSKGELWWKVLKVFPASNGCG